MACLELSVRLLLARCRPGASMAPMEATHAASVRGKHIWLPRLTVVDDGDAIDQNRAGRAARAGIYG